MFEKQIEAYEILRKEYMQRVTSRMNRDDLKEYNEVLFSAHSCAIEGNSFSVNDTRELKEKGLGVIPKGKRSLRPSRCSTISMLTNISLPKRIDP